MECARFEVQGRVQEVGYRVFVWRAAEKLKLRGWVRNRADRAVEVAAAGTGAALDQFERQLRQGPPAARVDSVARLPWAGEADGFSHFEILDD